MKRLIATSALALAAAAAVFSVPTAARAGDRFDIRFESRDRRDRDCDRVSRVWVPPVYEDRCTKVWVEPVYRTVCEKVWVPERYEVKCDRVWVEPVFEYREVVRYEHGRRCCVRERVCVRPGGYQTVERRVCIPGYYRTEDRQVLVCAGHFEERRERVCVREGHWDEVAEHHHGRDRDRLSLNIGVFGRF
jgi:hypothetical protein